MIWFVIAGIVISIFVLVVSLMTMSKGYAYKHTVDPLPPQPGAEEQSNKDN